MSSLVDKLRKAGSVKARGEFTLDVAQAGSKLSRFQFRDEREFLFQLVGGLYRLGATAIQITHSNDTLKLELGGLPIDEGVPQELGVALLEEFSPLRRLAAATQAILAHQPGQFLWVGSGQGQSFDYLTDTASKWNKVRLQEIRLAGLPKDLIQKAIKELEKQAIYNRRVLTINGRNLTTSLCKTGRVAGHPGWCHCDPLRTRPDLRLVVDEMCSEPKTLVSEIPWCGVIYWQPPEIKMDASLASVVEDETYQHLLSNIPSTYGECVLALIPEVASKRVVYRDFILELLRPPAPAWLQAIYPKLGNLDLFEDQNGVRWTLTSLRQSTRQVYYTTTAPPTGLPELILVEKSLAAVICLQIHLGERLEEATPLVLQRLQRQANQQRWSEQPVQGLQLPAQNWLLQKTMERWSIGLPDDWSQPGGTVTLVHQGKFLAKRELKHAEITFHLVCELEEPQISPLWSGIADSAWLDLEPQWLYSVEELIKDLASSHDDLGPIRSYLLGYLAKSRHPENSYFSKTLLFRDWLGQPHSIYSLLFAKGQGKKLGHVTSDHHPEQYPAEILPQAVYVVASALELRCLSQVKGLALIDFNLLLDDLWQSQNTPFPEPLRHDWTVSWEDEKVQASLEVTPDYGEGRVHVKAGKLLLGVQAIPSRIGFVAHIQSDHLAVQVRLDNQRLGLERCLPTHNSVWKRFLDSLEEKTRQSVRLRLESLPSGPWELWARQGLLQGLAVQHPELSKVKCWATTPQTSNLDELLAAQAIHWSRQNLTVEARKDFVSSHPGLANGSQLLYAPLNPAEQQQLDKWYGGNWQCADAWFEQKARLKEFLGKAPAQLGYANALDSLEAAPPLRGRISLVDDPKLETGTVDWLYRDRLVCSEPDFGRPGLRAQVECEQLEVNDNFNAVKAGPALLIARQQVAQQMTKLLASWLARPRPQHHRLTRLWKAWDELGGEVSLGLRQQPWIFTNQGQRSWNQLLEVERLYRLPAAKEDIPKDLTVVFENRTPQRIIDLLMSKHPQDVGVKATEKYLSDLQRQQQQRDKLQQQARRLLHHPYKIELQPPYEGEIGLATKAEKDCWLVTPQRAFQVYNLPNGLLGYLTAEGTKIRKVGSIEVADLSLNTCKEIYCQVLPLFLRRIEAGDLKPVEREIVAEYCLASLNLSNPHDPQPPWLDLAEARWIPCADGTLVSLHQLRLECQEQKQLLYWPKNYSFSDPGAHLTPLLSTPLLLELVTRWVGRSPTLREKPLLHRDVRELAAPKLSSLREVLEGLGRWVRARPGIGLTQGLKKVIAGADQVIKSKVQQLNEQHSEAAEKARLKAVAARQQAAQQQEVREQELQQMGRPLLTALRRQASLLLQGVARKETLRCLDRATWSNERSSGLWQLKDSSAVFYANHPELRPWLGTQEPPAPVTLSLLLGLVSTINARSEPFTDAMEQDFLERLIGDVVQTYRDVMTRKEA